MPALSRRPGLALAAVVIIILGLAVHFLVPGALASLVADALFTVLMYLAVAFLFPAARPAAVALAAFAISAAIELAQLTGLPALWAVAFPPSRLVFGTTFAAWDLVAYAVGAVVALLLDQAVRRRAVLPASR